jgi:coproporphyrinogen dehydrogenase HemZ
MPTLRLCGHQHSYPASDILRLFYGPLNRTEPGILQAGPSDPLIESGLETAGPDRVRIWTILGGCRLESSVPASLARREIKRQLYQILSQYTGYQYPWGSLTGIRPTLIASECLADGRPAAEAREEMASRWFVSPEKAGLAVETAMAEQTLLSRIPAGSLMVYIGVPFCPSRCAYCSFITQDALSQAGLLGPYVEAVIYEAGMIFRFLPPETAVSAVYLGGGTPTALPDGLFSRLLKGVLPVLPMLPGAERTVEAGRPDTVTMPKLEIIREAGATRLCINPQTFHDATLERIGRFHTTGQTCAAFSAARSMGFGNINMDLIAGLPGETTADFAASLEKALQLGADSLTIHALSVKRAARFSQQIDPDERAGFGRPDPGPAEMVSGSYGRLKAAGLAPYYLYRQKDTIGGLENTGYAKPGEGCLYNVGMMGDGCTVIGLGSGAMTKVVRDGRIERLANPRDIAGYISRVAETAEKKLAFIKANLSGAK